MNPPVPAGLPARVRTGVTATVRVPASSANLGPGFDALGLALRIHDVVSVTATGEGLRVDVEGNGADTVARDESHLVVRAVRAGLDHAGAAQPGLHLQCRNGIPHGRGLGSSAAAVVAGLVAARGLLGDPSALDDDAVLRLASSMEGHPDNVAAALLGGCTVAWRDEDGTPAAVRVDVHSAVRPVVHVPDGELLTRTARALLPAAVPHADAAYNAGRAALLVHALARRPDLLLPATEDRLHQAHRAPAMPESAALVARLRAAGVAAVVSGAGPSVLALATDGAVAAATDGPADAAAAGRWTVLDPGMDLDGAVLATVDTEWGR